MAQLLGYAERGLVNALFQSIAMARDPDARLHELLQRCWVISGPESGLRLTVARIQKADIYIEPGLSDYGNPDVVIITHHADDAGSSGSSKTAWFIEAKLGTFADCAGLNAGKPPALDVNSSRIRHELFLKGRLYHLLRNHPEKLNKGVRIYSRKKRLRRIGTQPLVLDLARALADCSTAHFVGLTADEPFGEMEPKAQTTIVNSLTAIDAANPSLAADIDYGPAEKSWLASTRLLSWLDIYTWAKSAGLDSLVTDLERNQYKLKPTIATAPDPVFKTVFEACGLEPRKQSSDKTTWYDPKPKRTRARFTCRVRLGLEGDHMAELYLLKTKRTVHVSSLAAASWAPMKTWPALRKVLEEQIPDVLRARQENADA